MFDLKSELELFHNRVTEFESSFKKEYIAKKYLYNLLEYNDLKEILDYYNKIKNDSFFIPILENAPSIKLEKIKAKIVFFFVEDIIYLIENSS